MVTYPSTYGVFEDGIIDIIDTVHQNGGQVSKQSKQARPAGRFLHHLSSFPEKCIPILF